MRQFLFWFGLTVTCGLALLSSGYIESTDGMLYAAVATKIVTTGLPDAPAPVSDDKNLKLAIFLREDGTPFSPTGLGYSLALAPAAALSEGIHKLYGLSPSQYFPLESDYVLHLFGSFANSVLGGIFVVIFFVWLRDYDFSKKHALILSLIVLTCTNIFPYTKFGFAHMLFLVGFVGTSMAIKRSSRDFQAEKLWMMVAGAFLGVVVLSYNLSFALTIPGLTWYFLLSRHGKWRTKEWFTKLTQNVAWAVVGGSPFLIIFILNNLVRTGSALDSGYGFPAVSNTIINSIKLIFEGLWGVFLSPGRSIFFYTPLLLTPFIFWQEIQWKKHVTELGAAILILLTYGWIYANQILSTGILIWHGESSWGPRYMLPVIPFGMLVTFLLMREATRFPRVIKSWFVLAAAFGLFVQVVGIMTPYQTKFSELPRYSYIGPYEMTNYDLGNFLPRFHPIFSMTRQMIHSFKWFDKYVNNEPNSFILADGFYFPDTWDGERVIRQVKPIAVAEWKSKQSTDTITWDFVNFMDDPASTATAELKFSGNVESQQLLIPAGEVGSITLQAQGGEDRSLRIDRTFLATDSAKQKLFLTGITFNNQPVKLSAIDLPYVQPLMSKMTGQEYYYWGKTNTNAWDWWDYNSRIYQNSPDIWWLRMWFYRDLPHTTLSLLATGIASVALLGAWKCYTEYKK